MTKKASLSLSVNAIVILILAITMLGLGLGFIRGMFGNVQGKIAESIAAEQDPATPDGRTPITISRESIITEPGQVQVVKLSAYNPTNADWQGGLSRCPDVRLGGYNNYDDAVGRTTCTATAFDVAGTRYNCSFNNGGTADDIGDDSCIQIQDSTATISCPDLSSVDSSKKAVCESAGCTYNEDADTCTSIPNGASPAVSCPSLSFDGAIQTTRKTISPGEFDTFNVVLPIPRESPGTYLCQFSIEGYTKDFTIKIE